MTLGATELNWTVTKQQ